ncbi:MAG: VCBS repeat-containing protein [Pseudomonadota bacterium]|nr:VCBS repeat-containing protein [Pseudomonadota bacterium]
MASRMAQAVMAAIGVLGAFYTADAMRHRASAHVEVSSSSTPRDDRPGGFTRWGLWGAGHRAVSANAAVATAGLPGTEFRTADPSTALAASAMGGAGTGTTTAAAAPATPVNYSFGAPVRVPLGGLDMRSLAVRDVTGDGRKDIILSLSSEDGTGRLAAVIEQTPGGALAPPRILATTGASDNPGLAIGDIDGDHVNDIVIGHRGGVTAFNSRNGFAGARAHGAGDAEYLAVLDINRDGRKDVFTQSWTDGGELFLGDGRGGMLPAQAVETSATGANTMMSGELTGDGIADLLLASTHGEQLGFWIYPGQRAGGFGAPVFHAVTSRAAAGPEAATIGDFNGDGRADVALAHGWTRPEAAIVVKFQQADGSFGPEKVIPVFDGPDGLATADIDGNGLDDIVVSHGGFSTLGYLLQSGAGLGAQVRVSMPMTIWSSPRSDGVAVGDVNGDRCEDIVVANSLNDLVVLHGQNCLPPKPPMSRPLPAMAAD